MKRLAACALLLVLVMFRWTVAAATSDQFHNKWPWLWTASGQITTLPLQGVHGCQPGGECVVAYDLVIAGDTVLSGAEGQVTALENTVSTCGSNLHYGNFVDVDGKRYAHLSLLAPSVVLNANLLQGDSVGTQRATGNVKPCDYPTDQRGKHLHWEFLGASAAPDYIDGSATAPLLLYGSPSSSNSVIGEFSTSGATLRAYYQTHGSWNAIGWTYNHCPGACTLNMTANKTWGRMQDFQHDPDIFGGTFDTVHVPAWNPSLAHLVDSVFWQTWAVGGRDKNGVVRPIGMAKAERGACPPGFSAACISYQPFDLGFVWMDVFTGRNAVFCPDLNGDNKINILDLTIESAQYGLPPVPPAVEVEGDDYVISILDLDLMSADYNHQCAV